MFGWFRSIFTNIGDHKGWQNNTPLGSVIEDVKPLGVDSSLQISTVWQCIDLISRTVATLPIDVLKADNEGRNVPDKLCNLHRLLAISPNNHMTPYEFWHYMTTSRVLRGNAYAKIERNGRGEVIALEPLSADQMNVFVDDNGNIFYKYIINGNTLIYNPSNILHWKGLGNGIVGLSVLEYMQTTTTESTYAQNNAVNMFANKGKINGILTAENILNEKQKKALATQFQNMRENGSVPVLEANLKYQQLSLSPADTQLLQTRVFTIEELCKWFGVPPAMITGDSGNLDLLARHFYKTTILPLCISAEQIIMQKIPCGQEKGHIVKFRLAMLNRASDSERATLNATYVQNGIKTRNEVRREEGWCDIEGGDIATAQTNLAPLDKLGSFDPSQTSQTTLITEPIKQMRKV